MSSQPVRAFSSESSDDLEDYMQVGSSSKGMAAHKVRIWYPLVAVNTMKASIETWTLSESSRALSLQG